MTNSDSNMDNSSPSKDRAPPVTYAVLLMNFEFNTVSLPSSEYMAPPYWEATLLVKLQFSTVLVPLKKIAPPNSAILFLKSMFSMAPDLAAIAPP